MIRIACVGISVMDRLYYVNQLPSQGGKFVANNYQEVGGGPAATAAVAAAKLGASVDFIGRVGDDDIGKSLLDELESYGVNTRFTKRILNAKSSQSAVIVDDNGERMIINFPSPDLTNDAQWLNDIDFSQWDIILADVRWHEGAKVAFQLAQKAGVTTLLDGDITPQDIKELVALSDHVAFSEPGLRKLTALDSIPEALNASKMLTNGHVYVTLGDKGCNWIENEELLHQPSFKVNVVDTTGAGDVFHGALAVSLAQGSDLPHAIKFASAVAALKCTRSGGRKGIPTYEAACSFMDMY